MARPKGEQPVETSSEPAFARLHLWQIQALRDAMVIFAAVVIVWAGYAMRSVTVPLLVALLLAYLFEPLVARMCKRPGVTRPMAVGGLLLVVGGTAITVLLITLPLLIGQTIQLIDDFRAGRFERSALMVREYVPESYRDEFDRLATFFVSKEHLPDGDSKPGSDAAQPAGDEAGDRTAPGAALANESVDRQHDGAPAEVERDIAEVAPDIAAEMIELRAEMAALREQLEASQAQQDAKTANGSTSNLVEFVQKGREIVVAVVGRIISIGLLAFLIPFYFFFFSVWYPSVLKFGNDLIPPQRRDRVIELLQKMDRAVAGFVRGRIVISLIMGVLLALGWQIVGVQYAIVLGFVIGFFSIVPYLGGVGIPLAVGLLWLGQVGVPESERMAWYMIIFWPCLVFGAVQVIETYFLTPMIAGKATNLDPVSILVAVLAGGAIMGVYGMLLAIPLAACLKILFVEVLLPRIKAWSEGSAEDPLPISRE